MRFNQDVSEAFDKRDHHRVISLCRNQKSLHSRIRTLLARSYVALKQNSNAIPHYLQLMLPNESIDTTESKDELDLYQLFIQRYHEQVLEQINSSQLNKFFIQYISGYALCLYNLKCYKETLDICKHYPNHKLLQLTLARSLLAMERYQQALTAFQNIHGNNERERCLGDFNQASCLRYLGRPGEAIVIYDRYPNDLQAQLCKSHCLRKMEQHQKALEIYNRHTNDPKFQLAMARCYQEMGQYQEALAIYNRHRNKPDFQLAMARCYEEMGQYQEALAIYNCHRNKPAFQLSMARCYENMRRYQETLDICERYPNNPAFQFSMARCYQKIGQHPEALAIYERYPNNEKFQLSMARCYQEMGQYQKTLDICTVYPDDPKFQLAVARCYEEMGQYQEALAIYERYPNSADFQLARALCYEKMGQYQEALAIYNRHRNNPAFQLSMARCYQDMGQYQETLGICERYPNNPDFQLARARCYQDMGQYQKALDICTVYPDDPKFQLTMVRCLQKMLANRKTSYYSNNEEVRLTQSVVQEHYAKLTDRFPYTPAIFSNYAFFLLFICNYDALTPLLDTAQEKFPYNIKFPLMRIAYLEKAGQLTQALEKAKQLHDQFPDSLEIKLALIKRFISNQFLKDAKQLVDSIHCNRLQHVIQDAIQHIQDESLEEKRTNSDAPHPSEPPDVFIQKYLSLSSQTFLSGNSVYELTLVTHPLRSFELSTDLRLPIEDQDMPEQGGTWEALTQCKDEYLYRAPDGCRIHFVKLPGRTNQSTADRLQQQYQRDFFTLCALYQDQSGTRHDPSGLGEQDLNEQRIRVFPTDNYVSEERVQYDPTSILDAVALRALATHHDALLEYEDQLKMTINQYKNFLGNQAHHLIKQARNTCLLKHLAAPYAAEFIEELSTLGLLDMIFPDMHMSAFSLYLTTQLKRLTQKFQHASTDPHSAEHHVLGLLLAIFLYNQELAPQPLLAFHDENELKQLFFQSYAAHYQSNDHPLKTHILFHSHIYREQLQQQTHTIWCKKKISTQSHSDRSFLLFGPTNSRPTVGTNFSKEVNTGFYWFLHFAVLLYEKKLTDHSILYDVLFYNPYQKKQIDYQQIGNNEFEIITLN